jgi:DNA-binding response OmpR family regulator
MAGAPMSDAPSEAGRMVSMARELVAHEVLVVDSDPSVGSGVIQLLAPDGLHVTSVGDPQKAVELLGTKFFGCVVVDLDTPGPNEGVEVVRRVHEVSPSSLVIVLSARKSFDAAVLAFRAGAHDVVVKAPDQVDYLKRRILEGVGEAARRGQRSGLFAQLREALDDFVKRFMETERRAQDLEDKLAGRDESRIDTGGDIRVLVVDSDTRLFDALCKPGLAPPGFQFVDSQSGGEAIDKVTSSSFHLAIVGPMLPDLPGSMVVKALRTQAPELLVMTYEPRGRVQLIESTRTHTLVEQFTQASQLTERLGELADAHRAKARERRYLQAFRERHYNLLRRMAELKKKLSD